jgi:hypothetical protein
MWFFIAALTPLATPLGGFEGFPPGGESAGDVMPVDAIEYEVDDCEAEDE